MISIRVGLGGDHVAELRTERDDHGQYDAEVVISARRKDPERPIAYYAPFSDQDSALKWAKWALASWLRDSIRALPDEYLLLAGSETHASLTRPRQGRIDFEVK